MEDVTKLLESFERLKGKKGDPLAGLSNFGNNAKEFMKLSRSTGALVASGVNQQFHPDSEEYKARSKLHKGMETLLDNRIFMGGWSAYDRSEEQEITTTTQVTTTQTEMVPIPGTCKFPIDRQEANVYSSRFGCCNQAPWEVCPSNG